MKITELNNIEKRAEKHLSLRDVLDFVSATALNEQTEKNAILVTTHIRSCRECRDLVKEYQALYDELRELDREEEFEQIALTVFCKGDPEKEIYKYVDPFKEWE